MNKSYENVKAHINDRLTLAKLKSFSFVAGLLEPYLTKYQSDGAMLPFVKEDPEKLFKDLLLLIIKPDVIASSLNFLKIDVADENNLLKLSKMHLGFACDSDLINRKNVVDAKLLKEFRCNAQKFVIGVFEKMSGRCPLGYIVVRAAECFSPSSLSHEKMKDEDLQSKMKQLTLKLVSLKIPQYSVGDKALLQFTEFLSKEKVTDNDKFSPVNRKTQRLDDLYFDNIMRSTQVYQLSCKLYLF